MDLLIFKSVKHLVILLLTLQSIYTHSQTPDEIAIQDLLQKEASTWRSGDVKAHAECWHIQPYSRILVSTADGRVIDVPVELMIHPSKDMVGRGGTAELSNFKMNISGAHAWVNHNEVSISKDGQKTYSYEFRILEKIEGQWKLVGQSIHSYLPDEK